MIKLCLGGITIRLDSERELRVEEAFLPFIKAEDEKKTDIAEDSAKWKKEEILAAVSWDLGELPLTFADRVGEDLIQTYYRREEKNYCAVWEGKKGIIACVEYEDDFSVLLCRIQGNLMPVAPGSLGEILRYFPMRAIFQDFHVLFFHASQITYQGIGILFSGPSGIGKTTQAQLWKQFRDAKILCNDRTLLRKQGENWYSYGYPLDGSSPVRSGEVHVAACVVLLGQSQDGKNRIRRLQPGEAAARLIPQLVIDSWNVAARERATEDLFAMLEDVPVYQLTATMDEQAVICLQRQLEEDKKI